MSDSSDTPNETIGDKGTLKKLIRKRGTIKGLITKFRDHVALLQKILPGELTKLQIRELELRIKKIEAYWVDFESIQAEIEQLTTSNLDEQVGEREVIDSQLYALLPAARDIVETYMAGEQKEDPLNKSTCTSMHGSCHQHSAIKLPTINLPSFDGNYLKWLEFRDTFESLIHSNDSIPNINKFHYLRSSLEGGAITVIKSIEFTSPNYDLAWNLLCERFNNKKILINNHLKALFGIESLTRESHKALRYLIDHILKNLRALESLGQPTDQWDTIIIYMVSSKLDTFTSRKWEEHKNNLSDLPSLSEFTTFLRNRADILETSFMNRFDKPDNKPSHHNNHKPEHKVTKSFVVSHDDRKVPLSCPSCQQGHRIVNCIKFKNMNAEDKMSEVLKLNLCSNCLRRGHEAPQCRLGCCRICRQKHNTMLCARSLQNESISTNSDSHIPIHTLPVSLPAAAAAAVTSKQVLLGTALVQIKTPQSPEVYVARALLDSGSQSSFMTEHLKEKLGLNTKISDKMTISGINNVPFHVSESCEMTLHSLTGSFNMQLKCLVIPQITGNLPNAEINASELNLPPNIQLADPSFHHSSEVDLLLGAEVFFDIINTQQIKLGPNMPTLQSSKLGWIIAGPLLCPGLKENKHINCNFTMEINKSLNRFWEIEELASDKIPVTQEHEICESHYLETTTRLPDGRFQVTMPMRESPESSLGDSYHMAKRRFFCLERKLNKDPVAKQQYSQFIKEYEDLGHLSKIDKPDFGYYMPHLAVFRPNSESSEIRVVFDCSAITSSGKSLNDIQRIGPVVQDELFRILLRFRQHKYVLTGDIQKMYRQIMVEPTQRNLQLIIWRTDENESLDILQLNTVTYGTASAPFLSTRCLLQLANDCKDPTIADVIKHDFYFDDVLTGSDSETGLAYIYQSVVGILSSACLPLHKFRTNCPQIFPNDDESCEANSLDLNKETSVLGLRWSPKTDTLHFSVHNIDNKSQNVSKRYILSNTLKVFDPLGLISPCTIKLKILLQSLSVLKLGWDDAVPDNIKRTWKKFTTNMLSLETLSVPRYALSANCIKIDLHCFVDASQDAYGASIYLRTTDSSHNVYVNLLCSKARVAPLKQNTIPRLELCGALLGARLAARVVASLRCDIHTKVFWTDSSIVLGWIKTQPKVLKAFVCNRINEIHELTDRGMWRHVPTSLNPADLASRGVEPSQLESSSLWWQGPSFLDKDESCWPQTFNQTLENELPELKSHTCTLDEPFLDFSKYSDAQKLKRIFAYVLRFAHNCRKPENKRKDYLQIHEINNSLTLLIKIAQQQSFPSEINTLKLGNSLTLKSNLLQLAPFVDNTGVLRVGGRLDNSDCDFNKKHPALLNGKHHFTKMLMENEHLRLFHAGPQLLLSSFREQFWPISGRILARSIVRKCILCTRLRGRTVEPLMGNLPADRVNQNYPFQVCGTDFAGPIYISSKKGRGNKITKCYLCLFICFSTKALHLEIVSDLTSNAFILSLKRLIGRRGKPHTIHCDNGSNYIGANNELGRVLKSSLNSLYEFSNNEGIQFVFNPPYSPTFGGVWEAGVKSAKFHLKRIMGNASLTFEELSTLATQIEAILNSRPLTPLSSDPNDFLPLTPGHFLIGRPLTSLPSPPVTLKCPNRYQRIEQLRQHFWQRWRVEYLAELQQRTKWRLRQRDLKTGDLVVFKEENVAPLYWRLGRVHQLYPGKDGITRVADFLTARGTIRRAVNRVCPLLTSEDLESQGSSQDFQGPPGMSTPA